MKYPNIIAIDGPAASGKTTIANQLAEKWRYLFFDTGVMYRAVTWMALHKNISTKDEGLVTDLADRIKIDVAPPSRDDGREYDVIADKVIMVGRDIGTVVLPEADLKIYLDACVEERANRRYKQRLDRGENVELGKILKKLEKRDNIDSTREVAPLRAAEDAVLIYTDDLSIGEVVSKIEKIALNMMKE